MTLSHRLARMTDIDALRALMGRAIGSLQNEFLSPDQVVASSQVMGLDTQLVKDQTYFLVEADHRIVGCGGWSWRATLFGGDNSMVAREPLPLDPVTDAAKIRAMYTDPEFARRGIGSRILELCEEAALEAGFAKVEMMATLAGAALYRARGYADVEPIQATTPNGVSVPLIRMGKRLSSLVSIDQAIDPTGRHAPVE